MGTKSIKAKVRRLRINDNGHCNEMGDLKCHYYYACPNIDSCMASFPPKLINRNAKR